MENIDIKNTNFEIPSDVLDEIQKNIEHIIKSFDVPEDNKTEVIKKINFMYTQTKQLSVTDPLTRLYNRRRFESDIVREYARAKRYKSPLSLAIIDIDFFKKINDTYGHSCGDYVLSELAYLMINNFRQTDIICRYGGEEFAVILTETPATNVIIPLERLRKTVESYNFKYQGQLLNITISIGVSSNINFADALQMFDDADNALYEAKKLGRNMIRSSE